MKSALSDFILGKKGIYGILHIIILLMSILEKRIYFLRDIQQEYIPKKLHYPSQKRQNGLKNYY